MIWIPPGEKHWHGASATTPMTHTAVQKRLDGRTVDWMSTSATRSTAVDTNGARVVVKCLLPHRHEPDIAGDPAA